MREPSDHGQDEADSGPHGPGETTSRLEPRVVAELRRWLAEPLSSGLYLVATPIGNLGDITLRALAVLSRADVIYCEDTRHSRHLTAHFGIERPLRPYHEHNADAERPRVLEGLAAGRVIALISDAGTPLISDPGFKLVREAVAAGHAVTALPGASAVLAGLTVSGLPTDRFHFAGFLPSRDGQRRTRLTELSATPATLILFEAPNRAAAALADIAEIMGGDRPVAVARELTKRFEEVRRGTASEVAAWAAGEAPRGEVVLLVGQPPARDATETEIEAALAELLSSHPLKEAARTVADRLAVPRTRAYEIGLRLKARE
jgi:16S rRNA (cytidine1402-2'-O)-methyltransferase